MKKNTESKKNTKSKAAYFTANLFLPLSEIARMTKAARYAITRTAERVRLIKPTTEADTEVLSFDEAVTASGFSRDALMRRYLFIKRLWLVTFAVMLTGTMLLITATLLAGVPVVGVFLLRLLSLLFMLSSLCALLFVFAMKNQFRLWQLTQRRLGTFAEWRASGTWLNDIFGWRMPS